MGNITAQQAENAVGLMHIHKWHTQAVASKPENMDRIVVLFADRTSRRGPTPQVVFLPQDAEFATILGIAKSVCARRLQEAETKLNALGVDAPLPPSPPA